MLFHGLMFCQSCINRCYFFEIKYWVCISMHSSSIWIILRLLSGLNFTCISRRQNITFCANFATSTSSQHLWYFSVIHRWVLHFRGINSWLLDFYEPIGFFYFCSNYVFFIDYFSCWNLHLLGIHGCKIIRDPLPSFPNFVNIAIFEIFLFFAGFLLFSFLVKGK